MNDAQIAARQERELQKFLAKQGREKEKIQRRAARRHARTMRKVEERMKKQEARKTASTTAPKDKKLGKKATILLECLQAGETLTKKEWSKRLYGDEEHTGNISGLIRQICDRTDVPVATFPENPGKFPQEPHIVKIVTASNKTEAFAVNKRTSHDVQTRMNGYGKFAIGIFVAHPEFAAQILATVEQVLVEMLQTKKNLRITGPALEPAIAEYAE